MSSRRGNAQTPSYARLFTFSLGVDAEAAIGLSSSVDTFLYLMEGHGTAGGLRAMNDDAGPDTRDSRIEVDLAAGDYTIEATTYRSRQEGSFTLTVATDIAAAAPVTITGLQGSYDATAGELFSAGFTYEPDTAEVSIKTVAPSGLSLALKDRSGAVGLAGTPKLAGLYRVALEFSQPGRTDTAEFTVSVSCKADHTQQADRSCLAPPECPAVSWGALGLDSRTAATAASWAATDCTSKNRPAGRYARYYNFTLDAAHRVAIDLSSRHDTYLYLMSGGDTRKGYLYRNDDIDWPADTDSRILERLTAGAYTVEATTAGAGRAGSFNVQARIVAAPALTGFDSIHDVTVGDSFSTSFTYRPAAALLTTSVDPATLGETVTDDAGEVTIAATPQFAGTYTITLKFAQPGRTDTRTITITAACPAGEAPFHTGGGLCVAVSAVPAGCSATALPARTPWWGRTDTIGAYSTYGSGAPAACSSLSQNSRAKYYSFTVPGDAPADGLPARIALEPVLRQSRPGSTPPLTTAGGSPSVTLWRYMPASGPNRVQQLALTTARPAADPVLTATLTAGDYLIEIAPTGTVTSGWFQLKVWVPAPQRAHSDVQHVGSAAPGGGGMALWEFLNTRGSLAKSNSIERSDTSDPASPTHPWLAFTADWCSVPPSWQVNLLQTIVNLLPDVDVDLAQYIVQQPSFGGVSVPFYYGCLRHDFNWRNLHRVKHHFGVDAAWPPAARLRADQRLGHDLVALCNANQRGYPEVPDTWDWTLSRDDLPTCRQVAWAFFAGVQVPGFDGIDYDH